MEFQETPVPASATSSTAGSGPLSIPLLIRLVSVPRSRTFAMTLHRIPAGLLLVSLAGPASADNFARLDEALPTTVDISGTSPVFDFDTDGCLPSAGISRA